MGGRAKSSAPPLPPDSSSSQEEEDCQEEGEESEDSGSVTPRASMRGKGFPALSLKCIQGRGKIGITRYMLISFCE